VRVIQNRTRLSLQRSQFSHPRLKRKFQMAFPTYANQVQAFAGALWGLQIGSVTMSQVTSDIAAVKGLNNALNSYYTASFGSVPTATVAATVAANLGLTGEALTAGTAYITAKLNAAASGERGIAIAETLNLFASLASDATFGAAATAWNAKVDAAAAYNGTTNVTMGSNSGQGSVFTLSPGVDTFTGTSANDTFNASVTATSATLGGLDSVDGGAGTADTLNIADTATAAVADFALPTGMIVKNIEVLNVTTNGAIGTKAGTAFDVSGMAGLTSVSLVAAGAGTAGGSNVKAAGTTDVSLTVSGNNQVDISGGKAVTVVSGSTGTGTVGVVGAALTSVFVKGGGVATVDNTSAAAVTAVGTTMTAVTLDGISGATAAVKGAALASVTVKNQITPFATTVTNGTSTALTVNVDKAGYTAAGVAVAGVTVAAGAAATAITLNATGGKSNVAVSGAAVKTLNIIGTADLILSAPITTVTKMDGAAATGGLTLGVLDAATVAVTTGAGKDSLSLSATTKATIDTGAGNDTVTLASAVASGSTITLGAGDDAVLVLGGSVAASTATAVTLIDAGDGTDTVAAALINAANAGQFKNFESIDTSAAANLDVELMTGSAITGLTLSGGAGGANLSNVAAGVGVSVTGTNNGETIIGVKSAAIGTADSFTTTFAGVATSIATAAAPTVIAAGTITTNGVESLTVTSAGTGFVTNTLAVTDSALQTLTITGDKGLALTFVGANGTAVTGATDTVNGVKLLDGSAATGALVVNTTNVTNVANAGLTVKTGSAKDTITLAQKASVDAGAGDDTISSALNGGAFTGGAGNDKFDVSLAVATGVTAATATFVTIADIAAGDAIKLLGGNVGTTMGAKTALTEGVTTLDLALAIPTLTDAVNEVSWFQYGTNTYVVANNAVAGFAPGDLVVKLTGLIDLSTSTLDITSDYLTIV
jgi:hypothetical protein